MRSSRIVGTGLAAGAKCGAAAFARNEMRGLIAAPRRPLIATAVPRVGSKPADLAGTPWKSGRFTRLHGVPLRPGGEAIEARPFIRFVTVAAKFVDRPQRARPSKPASTPPR